MWVYWKIKPKAKNVLDFTQICSLFATSLAQGGVGGGEGGGGGMRFTLGNL